jgi:hypothetical protein
MASKQLRNRSYSTSNNKTSDSSDKMENSDVSSEIPDTEGTTEVVTEQPEQQVNTVDINSDKVTNCTDTNVNVIPNTQLQELLSTLLQTIQSENCKLTATLEAKVTSEINKLSAESAKQIATLEININSKLASATEKLKSELKSENEKLAENLIAKCEKANAAVQEKLNAKLDTEIKAIKDKIDNVSKEHNNKFITLTNNIKGVQESMTERINSQVSQSRKEIDKQGLEITAVTSSVLASIKEHKEQIEVTVSNVSQELGKAKEYTDGKLNVVSKEIQEMKQYSVAEIAKLSSTVGTLQVKLMSRSSDHTSSAVPTRDDVRSDAVLQGENAANIVGSNDLSSMNGVNGCSTSVCNDVNSVNQFSNSCNHANVNVTSEVHARSAGLSELTLPIFSDSSKQVPRHFIRDLDQYFNLKQTPNELRLPLVIRAIQEPFAKQWVSSSFEKLKSYDEFKKAFTDLLWNPSRQASIRSSIYLDKYDPNSGESYMNHYIRYANMASTLDPPMTDVDLLSALTSHFEPKIQQGLICGSFRNTQDTLTFLAKYQGFGENGDSFGENRENFRTSRREYDRREGNRQWHNPNGDGRQKDRRNNVNVSYIRRQTEDQRRGRYNNRNQSNQDGRNFNRRAQGRVEENENHNRQNLNGRAQGRVEESEVSRLNPTAPRFDPRDVKPPAETSSASVRSHSDEVQRLNE